MLISLRVFWALGWPHGKRTAYAAVWLALLLSGAHAGAQSCTGAAAQSVTLKGQVVDSTGALVPGADVTLDGGAKVQSGPDGRFIYRCVARGKHTVTVARDGFAPLSANVMLPKPDDLLLRLMAGAQTTVEVQADDDLQVPTTGGTNGLVVSGKQLQALADDPDDLLREIQQLAAASGGSPGNTTISVDGFQDSAQLPPKDSIAYVQVAPDLFSAEYREPPYGGGRVEVYTKPGAKNFHGALFGTNSSSFMNARDPFTQTTGTIGKQRYGFDFSGPIRRQGSNFSMTLEHRSIDETVGVDATTSLDANGNGVTLLDTVPQPQQLWVGQARVDWQLGPKNIAFVSYSANVNHLANLGVGGQTLREAGYDSGQNDETVRASDVTTISPRLIHEARVSFERFTQTSIPTSTAPSLQVSGYFTGGGATTGNTRDRRYRTEYDDDFILTTKNQLIKAGIQLLYLRRNSDVLTNFNGTYIFSGYGAGTPASPSVSALQQYGQVASAGGTATEFNNVAGDPHVPVSQVRFAGFYQDNIKLSPKWSASYGLRYALETDPANYNSIEPRGGFTFTPDKKQTWVLKAHFGVFNNQFPSDDAQELHREDGVYRITSLVYNPTYGAPLVGAAPIHAYRTSAVGFNAPVYVSGEFSVSKELPHGFSLTVQTVLSRSPTNGRTVNINQPLGPNPVPSPYGPRPIAPNVNILETRSDGHGSGRADFIGLSNYKMKRVQFFVGGLHLVMYDNGDGNLFYQPQSAYSDAGEYARPSDQSLWQVFGTVTVALPYKLSLSGNGYANGGHPFNILTGADNNGDGNFNDRPQYAPAGSTINTPGVFETPFGLLTNAGAIVNGVPVAPIARNLGALPWNFYLDANLQRAFALTKDAKAPHHQTLTANVRSANFLNHTNVTAEDNVIGSTQFLAPTAASTARRIEAGLRYSF